MATSLVDNMPKNLGPTSWKIPQRIRLWDDASNAYALPVSRGLGCLAARRLSLRSQPDPSRIAPGHKICYKRTLLRSGQPNATAVLWWCTEWIVLQADRFPMPTITNLFDSLTVQTHVGFLTTGQTILRDLQTPPTLNVYMH